MCSVSTPTYVQFTLLIHRINLATETPPDTGISSLLDIVDKGNGTTTYNTYSVPYNCLSAGPGQVLIGLSGLYGINV